MTRSVPPASTSVRALRSLLPENPLVELLGGLISAMVVVTFAASFAGLIFSGELSPYYHVGIGLGLMSAVLIGATMALSGSFPGTVAGPQDKPAAILGVALASTGVLLPEQQLLPTTIALIAITSLVFGVSIYTIGYFRLGGFVRYMPYPVVGGFLAGTGWLVLLGAFGFVGSPLDVMHPDLLLQRENLMRWVPAAVFGGLLHLTLRRSRHVMILPAFIVGGVAASYALFHLPGPGFSAGDAGLLLDTLPDSIWRPDLVAGIWTTANWSYVWNNSLTIAAVVLVSIVAMLLNETGIEVATRTRMDFNRDLRSAGFANAVLGLGGGLPGYPFVGLSILNHRLGVSSRFVGMLAASISALVLFYGADLLSVFPRWIVAGMLFYLAFDFLSEWLLDSRHTCTPAEYGVILLIVLCIVAFGILQGVGVGIIVTMVLFVFNYSRVDVIKTELDGSEQQSNVQRSPREEEVLYANGSRTIFLELNGYLFFGTTNRILERLVHYVEGTDRALRFFVLDFRRVSGADSSAILSFIKLRHFAEENGVVVALTHLDPELSGRLRRGGCIRDDGVCVAFPDMDRGLEWCEDQLLEEADASLTDTGLMKSLERHFDDHVLFERLRRRLVRQEWRPGSCVFRQGDQQDGMYFVESGSVSIMLDSGMQKPARLRKLGPGTLLGEMGVYTGALRSASAIVEEPAVLYHLSGAAVHDMERVDPDLASALHRYIVGIVAQRVEHANKTLSALRR